MKFIKNLILGTVMFLATVFYTSCEQEELEPLLTIEDGAGTLTNFKAYKLDSIVGVPESAFGRIVFWEALDGKTLVQLSLYNVPEGVSHPSLIREGDFEGASTAVLRSLYDVENNGEEYTVNDETLSLNFGEFSTSKYFVIPEVSFYSSLDTYDAHVVVTRSDADATVICEGDIGSNADPVEEN